MWLSNQLRELNVVEASAELSNASVLADVLDMIGDSVEAFLQGFTAFFQKFDICYTSIMLECIDKKVCSWTVFTIVERWTNHRCTWGPRLKGGLEIQNP